MMNSTEEWVKKFTDQLNCVSCRQYKSVELYKDTGEKLDYHMMPVTDIHKNLNHIDVWCDDCTVRNIHRIRTPGRMSRKREASVAASLAKSPWYESSSKEQVLSRGVVTTKQDFLSLAKQHPCMHCGTQYHGSAMEFHKTSMRTESVQKLVSNASGVETLIKEMEQCSLLCANCHRIVHSGCFYLVLPQWRYDDHKEKILSKLSRKG